MEKRRGRPSGALVIHRSFAIAQDDSVLLPGEAGVGAIADFGEFLGQGQELLGLVGEQLVQGSETYLTFQEVLELGPVGLL